MGGCAGSEHVLYIWNIQAGSVAFHPDHGLCPVDVIRNLKKTLALFLQAVPENFNLDEVKTKLLAMEHVHSLHHTHLWSMDGEHHVLTTHV